MMDRSDGCARRLQRRGGAGRRSRANLSAGRGRPGLSAVLGAVLLLSSGLLSVRPLGAQEKLRVVTTLTSYAAIAREVTGDLADVQSIARGDMDPHFVNARPSYAALIQKADLLVATGLDLELWLPGLLDRANNSRVVEGSPGYVAAYAGIKMLQVPTNPSRAAGDIHVYGNPHVHTDPVNGIIIARNILVGLRRVDPSRADAYARNEATFEDRVMRRTFGDSLVDMLGSETLFGLARSYKFWDFARGREFRGKPLTDYLGGWMAKAAPFRGRRMACYHLNWAYFSARFDVDCAIYIENKPGIPPSPGHVQEVIDFMRREHLPALMAANYFSRAQVERVAQRTGATAVLVPGDVGGGPGSEDYFATIDLWVSRLADAFTAHPAGGD
jgi:zinc/manganese transport system substrate-binding protein